MVVRCLIATCSNYDHHGQLPRAEGDGLRIKQALIDRGVPDDHIDHLKDFTRDEIFEKADSLARELKRSLGWLVFVAMCHGYEQDGNGYLRPRDSSRDNDDFPLHYLTNQMLPESGVFGSSWGRAESRGLRLPGRSTSRTWRGG